MFGHDPRGIGCNCALTCVENNVSVASSNGSGMLSCPFPAAHDVAESVFLPRLFERGTHGNVIGRDNPSGPY